jgi:hypothetical protein
MISFSMVITINVSVGKGEKHEGSPLRPPLFNSLPPIDLALTLVHIIVLVSFQCFQVREERIYTEGGGINDGWDSMVCINDKQ